MALLALAACSRKVDAIACRQMLNRYVELSSPPGALPAKTVSDAYKRAEQQCTSEVTSRVYVCAMEAMTSNDWEACIE